MKLRVVADVGNSRVKWGRCRDGQIVDVVALPPDDPQAWQNQRQAWQITARTSWAVAGVHPERRDRLVDWLGQCGDQIQLIHSWQQLPLRVPLEQPQSVGIDRLLNAVAASQRLPPGVAAVLIDAGSAITVDWLETGGAFAGGAIFPGLRLMAQALHDYTALLPLVKVEDLPPPVPAPATSTAIAAGIFWAAAGGIEALVQRLTARAASPAKLFVTGGDGPLLAKALNHDLELWPNMTLEGIRIAAETTP